MESHFPISSGHQSHLARERVIEDVRALVDDGELLLKATADELGEKAHEARRRLAEMINRAKNFLAACQAQGLTAVRQGALRAELGIQEHPFTSVAAALGVGFCLGVLVSRRRR